MSNPLCVAENDQHIQFIFEMSIPIQGYNLKTIYLMSSV